MRFISKVLKDTLHEKFPDATEDELVKVRRCLNLSPYIKLDVGSLYWSFSSKLVQRCLPKPFFIQTLSLSLALSPSFTLSYTASIATMPLFLSFILLSFP
jgi:hypothetical protein